MSASLGIVCLPAHHCVSASLTIVSSFTIVCLPASPLCVCQPHYCIYCIQLHHCVSTSLTSVCLSAIPLCVSLTIICLPASPLYACQPHHCMPTSLIVCLPASSLPSAIFSISFLRTLDRISVLYVAIIVQLIQHLTTCRLAAVINISLWLNYLKLTPAFNSYRYGCRRWRLIQPS